MASLLEKIQRSMDQSVTSAEAGMPAPGQSQKIAKMMAARSGKAVGAPVPMSNLGEQSANEETQQQLTQLRQNVETAKAGAVQQVEQQQAQTDIANSGIDQQQQIRQQQLATQTQQLLQQSAQDSSSLDTDKKAAQLEQLASNLALKDRRYTDTLQREGKRRRLDNSLQFKRELTRSIFGDNEMLLRKHLGNKDVLEANDREFKRALGRMDMNAALELARNAAKAQKTQQMYSGAGQIAKGGIAAYGSGDDTPDKPEADYYGQSTGKPSSGNVLIDSER
jgi:hypothetical protein